MNPSSLSIFVFGIYLLFVGVSFLFIPNVILPLFRFEKTEEFWPNVLGAVIAILGYYYIVAAQNDLTVFYWATVYGRFAILICFMLMVVFKKAKPMLILFGAIDTAGGIWTLLALT